MSKTNSPQTRVNLAERTRQLRADLDNINYEQRLAEIKALERAEQLRQLCDKLGLPETYDQYFEKSEAELRAAVAEAETHIQRLKKICEEVHLKPASFDCHHQDGFTCNICSPFDSY